jgi:hypothetical protein
LDDDTVTPGSEEIKVPPEEKVKTVSPEERVKESP